MRPRVVVVGMGDTGTLTAIGLARHCEVVGVTTKEDFVSSQELGTRITRPDRWQRDNRFAFDRMRRLDGVRILHGSATGVDLAARELRVRLADGSEVTEPYDVLIVASGVTNGFWRRPDVLTSGAFERELESTRTTLGTAGSVAVVGGGAAAVNAAAHLALSRPDRDVDLYFPGDRCLHQHHRRVWAHVERRLTELGVRLHAGHRAVVPDGFGLDAISRDPLEFTTGQPPASADAVVWAIGRTSPNTGWLPADLLDADGFVRVEPTLQVPRHPEVFAVGDVAATDPLRCSARNRADRLVAANVRAFLAGRALGAFRPTRYRWGAVLGIQPHGIDLYLADGRLLRLPDWSVRRVIVPWYIPRRMYGGIRHG